jgi:hypothetical protein
MALPAAGCHSLRGCTKASPAAPTRFLPQSFGRRRRVINVYMSEYSYRFSIMPELTALCVKSLVVNNGAGRVITARQCLSIFGRPCAHICAPSHQNIHFIILALSRFEFIAVNSRVAWQILNASDNADGCHSSYIIRQPKTPCLLRRTGLFN